MSAGATIFYHQSQGLVGHRGSCFRRCLLLLFLALSTLRPAHGQLQFLPDSEPFQLFGGGRRQISVRWTNTSPSTVMLEVRTRLLQTGSATAVVLGDRFWKRLEVLPGQTVLEFASLEFPAVRGVTRFLVQWIESTNKVLGITEVMLYPTNLLAELHALGGGQPVGVLDPQQQLLPTLKLLGVDTVDLQERGLLNFTGKLAIIGSFASKTNMPDDLLPRIKGAAAKGAGIVWIRPPPLRDEPLKPSFCLLAGRKGAVVVAQQYLVADLAQKPQSQLNLLHLARLAVRPEPPPLFELTQSTN